MDRILGFIIAGVIGAIALGFVGTKALAGFNGTKLNTAISDASDIANNARSVFGGTAAGGPADYSSLSNSNAISGGIVPSDMVRAGNTTDVRGPWDVSSVTVYGSSDTIYEDWEGVPTDSCAKFALSQKTNQVVINGTTVQTVSNSNAPVDAAAACSSANSSTNSLVFSFFDGMS